MCDDYSTNLSQNLSFTRTIRTNFQFVWENEIMLSLALPREAIETYILRARNVEHAWPTYHAACNAEYLDLLLQISVDSAGIVLSCTSIVRIPVRSL